MIKFASFILALSLTSTVSANQDLLTMYERAKQYDPLFSQTTYQKSVAEQLWWQRMGTLLPQLSASAQTSKNTLNNNRRTYQGTGKQDYWRHSFNLNLTQPIIRWDAWVQLDQADNEIAQRTAEVYAAEQSLMLRVAEAYFNVLASQDQLTFAKAEKTAIKQQLEQVKAEVLGGLKSKTAQYEAQAAYSKAVAREIETTKTLDANKELLKEIVGEIDINLKTLGVSIALVKPAPEDIQEWVLTSIQNNLDIISSFNRLEISRKEIQRQWGGHIPSVDLVGQYNITHDESSFGLQGDTSSIGLQFTIPLFEGGTTTARIKQAEYEYKISEQKLETIKRQVKKEIRNAYRGIISDISQVHAYKAAIISAEQALEGTKVEFSQGTKTMFDVLSEQRYLYKNKADHAQARYNYLLNSLRLKKWASSLIVEDIQSINALLK